MNSLKT